jgi:hypothetical protein
MQVGATRPRVESKGDGGNMTVNQLALLILLIAGAAWLGVAFAMMLGH